MVYELEQKEKDKIIALLEALIPKAKIYLYGSRARGDNHEWSDIDLAIDNGSRLPLGVVGEASDIMAATNLPYKISVVDFYNVSKDLQDEIVKDRKIWKT